MQQKSRTQDVSGSENATGLERRILAALEGLQFGAVEITVHEGKVVQIERREKFRFPSQLPAKS